MKKMMFGALLCALALALSACQSGGWNGLNWQTAMGSDSFESQGLEWNADETAVLSALNARGVTDVKSGEGADGPVIEFGVAADGMGMQGTARLALRTTDAGSALTEVGQWFTLSDMEQMSAYATALRAAAGNALGVRADYPGFDQVIEALDGTDAVAAGRSNVCLGMVPTGSKAGASDICLIMFATDHTVDEQGSITGADGYSAYIALAQVGADGVYTYPEAPAITLPDELPPAINDGTFDWMEALDMQHLRYAALPWYASAASAGEVCQSEPSVAEDGSAEIRADITETLTGGDAQLRLEFAALDGAEQPRLVEVRQLMGFDTAAGAQAYLDAFAAHIDELYEQEKLGLQIATDIKYAIAHADAVFSGDASGVSGASTELASYMGPDSVRRDVRLCLEVRGTSDNSYGYAGGQYFVGLKLALCEPDDSSALTGF